MEAGKEDVETYKEVVLREDYDALRALAARGELSDARIREIAERHADGIYSVEIVQLIEQAIRQALGER